MTYPFDYHEAYSRNIGWLTEQEQQILRHKKVAIAGMGGVGGIHLLTLARLGVASFHIADLDDFELANFNRQAGATMTTLGRAKVDVLAAMAREINPEISITTFPEGVTQQNIAAFLKDVDLYVDGLDFFVFSARQMTFAACRELGVPAITVAPLGMGAALLNFLPGRMSFEQYFRLGDLPEDEKALRFMLGLAPAGLQLGYLMDPSRVDLARHRGPSTIMACQICAGIAATESLKILLSRGDVRAAPHGVHFDAYRNKLAHTWRPWGYHNPIQRLAYQVARRRLSKKMHAVAQPQDTVKKSDIELILDQARWAPSGDNTQPWRFEVVSEDHVRVHGSDTREHCVYDLDGHPSQVAHGALLETLAIAASGFGLRATVRRDTDTPDAKPVYDVTLEVDQAIQPDTLIPYIPFRSVQRRAMRTRALTDREKQSLESAVGEGYRIVWLEDAGQRLRAARLMFNNAKLRLTIPEAYQVHRSVIEWNARHSDDKVPDQALGVDLLTARLMRWVMASWERVVFFNKYLAGTWAPRIQMDLIPGIACAAHFAIVAENEPDTIDDYVDAGRAVQRLWLTTTKLGLQLQPEMTPLIFGRYARQGREFSKSAGAHTHALELLAQLEALLGKDQALTAVFMGRIGAGQAPLSRSLRLSLGKLLMPKPGQAND